MTPKAIDTVFSTWPRKHAYSHLHSFLTIVSYLAPGIASNGINPAMQSPCYETLEKHKKWSNWLQARGICMLDTRGKRELAVRTSGSDKSMASFCSLGSCANITNLPPGVYGVLDKTLSGASF